MPTARKLPSGSWRCQVFSHIDENGKSIRKSFTCSDPSPKGKRICEEMASTWARDKETALASAKTFDAAVKEYIDLRRNTLSPRSIEEYERIHRLYLSDLDPKRIDSITQADIQKVINEWSSKLSPKTVIDIHGLISAVMKQERPQFALRTSLPQRVKPKLTIPSDEDVKAILEAVRGSDLELPVMLAAFGPMREGEICALRAENISGNTVHVCENMIKKTADKKITWIIRHPKSTESNRFIDYPETVSRLWEGKTGRITDMNPNILYKRFKQVLTDLKMPDIRFHDLRHWCASTLHANGVPDAYIMQRGGWSSDRTLKAVYRHTLDNYQQSMTELANSHFESIITHEITHKNEKTQ